MRTASSALTAGSLSLLTPSASADNIISDKQQLLGSLLTNEQVLNIVYNHINSFFATDEDLQGRTIVPSTEFIALYDFNDSLIAYIVPLVEDNESLGYITVSAITNGYNFYQVCFDSNAVEQFRTVLQQPGHIIRFIPPMTYIIENTVARTTEYYEFVPSVGCSNRTVSVDPLAAQTLTETILAAAGKQAQTSATQIMSTYSNAETYSLTKHQNGVFVPVISGNTTYYGGNQRWYDNTNWQSNGCGPVAAANIMYYLGIQRSGTTRTALYPYVGISQSTFKTHMNALYNAVAPSSIGELWLGEWIEDVKSYAASKGVTLTAYWCNQNASMSEFLQIVKAGLQNDSPVATLNLSASWTHTENGITDNINWHWMTITQYTKNSDNTQLVKVSSWGRILNINFDALYAHTGAIGGGLCYFV